MGKVSFAQTVSALRDAMGTETVNQSPFFQRAPLAWRRMAGDA
jgi:hypothetical protein